MASTVDLVYACIALFFACALSSAGGVGGGGLNVPIFILLCGFNFTLSSSLSLFVVLGNSIAQMWLNYKQRHPKDESQPLVFYAFVVLLLPAQLGGGNIGAAIKRLLSEEILFILAFIVLFIASSISLKKGIYKWQVESKELLATHQHETKQQPHEHPRYIDATQQHQAANNINDNMMETSVENPLTVHNTTTKASSFTNDNAINNTGPVDTERPSQFFHNLEMEMHSETDHRISETDKVRQSSIFDDDRVYATILWPWPLMVVLLIMWLLQLAVRLVNTVQVRCSPGYFISFCTIYLPLTFTCIWTLSYLHLQAYAPQKLPLLYLPAVKTTLPNRASDSKHNIWNNIVEHIRLGGENIPQWFLSTFCTSLVAPPVTTDVSSTSLQLTLSQESKDHHNINNVNLQEHGWYLAIVVFCIGLIANLLGIGGAELISPLLLLLKVSPEVASATSGLMNLLNTLANVLINVLLIAHQQETNNDDDETRHNDTAGLQMVLIVVGFFGGLIGRFSGLYVAKILKRASVIIFALVLGLYLTCVYYVYELAIDGADTSTKEFCSA